MSSFITLKKSDPGFADYLWGRFSNTQRAIAETSVNVNTSSESVTFKIVERFNSPLFVGLLKTLKLKNLYLSLTPLFLILLKNHLDDTLADEWLALLSAVSVICLQLGLELANDVQDHVRGLDRIIPRSGNFALLTGWQPAWRLQIFSRLLMGVAILFAVPSLILFPELVGIALAAGILIGLGYLSHAKGFKYSRVSEWIVFLSFGPLLTSGYQISFGGQADFESMIIGVLTGWLALLSLHLKNFSNLLVNAQAGFQSTMVTLGFDKAKQFIIYWWFGFIVIQIFYHASFLSMDWTLIEGIFLILVSIPMVRVMHNLSSSLGSKVQSAVTIFQRGMTLAIALWVLESLVIWFIMESQL